MFKDFILQILLGPFLNTLSYLKVQFVPCVQEVVKLFLK